MKPLPLGRGVSPDKEFNGNLLNSAVIVIWGFDKFSDKSAILIKNNEKTDISSEDLEFVITHFKKKAENYQNEIIEQYIKADKPMHIYMQKQLGLVPYFNH